jgi:hypothetical protein
MRGQLPRHALPKQVVTPQLPAGRGPAFRLGVLVDPTAVSPTRIVGSQARFAARAESRLRCTSIWRRSRKTATARCWLRRPFSQGEILSVKVSEPVGDKLPNWSYPATSKVLARSPLQQIEVAHAEPVMRPLLVQDHV